VGTGVDGSGRMAWANRHQLERLIANTSLDEAMCVVRILPATVDLPGQVSPIRSVSAQLRTTARQAPCGAINAFSGLR